MCVLESVDVIFGHFALLFSFFEFICVFKNLLAETLTCLRDSWPPISPRRYEPPHYAYLAVRTSPEQDAQTTGLTLDSYFFFPEIARFGSICNVMLYAARISEITLGYARIAAQGDPRK